MIFKKKYKRTEWMEGLLLAEKCLKNGYTKEEIYTSTCSERKILKDGEILYYGWGNNSSINFMLGVTDCIRYYEENKEILLKTLDK